MRVARSIAGCLTVLSRRCLGVRSVPMTESYFKSSRFMFGFRSIAVQVLSTESGGFCPPRPQRRPAFC